MARGLGRAYLAIVDGADARTALFRCVVRDPRWDRQVECRAGYYAELVIHAGLPLDELAGVLSSADQRGRRSVADVMAAMAVRGHSQALAELRRALVGPGWLEVLEAAGHERDGSGERLLRSSDIEAVVERWGAALVRPLVECGLAWSDWAGESSSLRRLFLAAGEEAPGRGVPRPRRRLPEGPLTVEQLLALVETYNTGQVARRLAGVVDPSSAERLVDAVRNGGRHVRLAAARALGMRADERLLREVQDWFEGNHSGASSRATDRVYSAYLRELPGSLALPLARRWLPREDAAGVVAQSIFAQHAEVSDSGPLLELLQSAIGKGHMRVACRMIEGLGNAGDAIAEEHLVRAYEELPYSYARHLALQALAACRCSLVKLATESLWDSDIQARHLALASAPLSAPRARQRAAWLAADPFQDPELRDLAARRLAASRH